MPQLVVFDCDNTMGLPRNEIDDGLTLLYLLGRPDVRLLGVTTTFGNGPIEQVQDQTAWLLDSLGIRDLPVERGAGRRGETDTAAARFLAETAAAHPGEVTVLATGPLGNLRAAAERDPHFFSNLKQSSYIKVVSNFSSINLIISSLVIFCFLGIFPFFIFRSLTLFPVLLKTTVTSNPIIPISL